jgi:hypothetical protein
VGSYLQRHKSKVIVGLAVLVLLALVWWFVFGFWVDSTSRQWKWFTQVFLERGFFPGGINPLHFTAWFWLCLFLAAGSLTYFSQDRRQVTVSAWFVAIASFCLFVVVTCFGINDHSGSYAGATTFVVEDAEQVPASLKRLADDADSDREGCALYTYNDMRGCIKEGTFDFEWDARTASATGAEIVIRRSSNGVSNTRLLSGTLTYIYGDGNEGTWTAIRDGKKSQPIYGVASWDGEGNVKSCTFRGKYAMNKAFGGKWGKNLSDEIASEYPELHYDNDDRYGYCDGDQPVIVIPVKEQQAYNTRTTFRSAGVIVITGSPDGNAQYRHVVNVKHGDFPGPVYPSSLAKEQREAMGMIAGIRDSIFGNFGFEPTDAETQSGNASEYQLRDKATGRVYWVTPMKPRSTDAQVLASYTVIPADEATGGSLNRQQIYVLPDEDPRVVNVEDLEARTRQALSQADNGFYQSGGKLAEFLPLSGEMWQVYAELSGRVVYRIKVPTDSRAKAEVVSLDETGVNPESTEKVPDRASACVEDLSTLSAQDLATCLSDIAEELNNRQAKKPK